VNSGIVAIKEEANIGYLRSNDVVKEGAF